MSIKDFFDLIGEAFSILFGVIKSAFYQLYTSEWGMTAIVMVVVFVYVFIKFAQWNDKKEYEQIKKRQEEDEEHQKLLRSKNKADYGWEDDE